MFSQFIVLLGFNASLERDRTKCLVLNDEPRMLRPTLTYMNTVELKYHLFMIILNKCTGSCKVLSRKICVPKKQNT